MTEIQKFITEIQSGKAIIGLRKLIEEESIRLKLFENYD